MALASDVKKQIMADYATADPAACLASRPVSKRMLRVPNFPLSMVATDS